jgi:hypothetical protein
VYTGGAFGVNPTGGLYWYTGGFSFNNTDDLLLTESWNHVAVIRQSGNINVFLNGSALINQANSIGVQYLSVAGGGGGASSAWPVNYGGGGGAGGFLTGSANLNFNTPYVVTVGAGGAGGVKSADGTLSFTGANGGNSSISGQGFSITSVGGGKGGGGGGSLSLSPFTYPSVGGSGGGAGTDASTAAYGLSTPGAAGTSGQGNSGGGSRNSNGGGTTAGGGGGGAGSAGATAPGGTSGAGAGGAGLANPIVGSTVGQLATGTYYLAGGGGGAPASPSAPAALGGLGGGGAGPLTGSGGSAGSFATGGGGGAGFGTYTNPEKYSPGNAGGSGVVVFSHSNTYPQATVTGNPTITTTGSNILYTFTASGSITFLSTPPNYYPIDYITVAGGGGGGGGHGGGGGAGGLTTGSVVLASGDPFVITVGAGGVGLANGFANTTAGSNGTTSSFFSFASTIGGGGGATGNGTGLGYAGKSGGSGGGGSLYTNIPGLGTAGQGNNGGEQGDYPAIVYPAGSDVRAGGGGGAGAVGTTGKRSAGATLGDGGAGLQWLDGNYYAGGGGGGSWSQSIAGVAAGGQGGGGAGGRQPSTLAGSGGANTGGGGGGGSYGGLSGSGGSGVVIIRHSSTLTQATVTGNPTITTTGTYTVYTFTASGSFQVPGAVVLGDNLTLTTATIGANFDLSEKFNGYISNLRVIKNQALFTGTFNVSSGPLGIAPVVNHTGAGVAARTTGSVILLTAADNRFKDKSLSNLSVTGTAVVSNFQPFPVPYNPNGSTYFNGTSDYLTVPYSTSLLPVSGTDFTAECWVFHTGATAVFQHIMGMNSNTLVDWHIRNENGVWLCAIGGSGGTIGTVVANIWTHIAIVQQTNTLKAYLNGVLVLNLAISAWTNNSLPVAIGARSGTPDRFFSGYISDARIVKGTAVYTANFTPPISPLTAITNTVLLTLQTNVPATNRAFNDTSRTSIVSNNAGSITQGTVNPFGSGWSGYFTGTTDRLTLAANDAFAFGTGAFCIEAWIYNNVLKNYSTLVTTRPNNSNYADAYHIGWDSLGGISLYVGAAASAANGPVGTIRTGVWQHIAVCRDANSVTSMYVDGVRTGSGTVSNNFTRNLLGIGDFPTTPAEGINGYISNLRLVKGSSVYDPTQTSIRVPTSDLPRIANTVLLTLQNNRYRDNSVNNFAITRLGAASIQRFSPFAQPGFNPVINIGSTYFNGSTDYLEMPHNINQLIGTGDFTIEAWVYLTSYTLVNSILSKGDATVTTGGVGSFLFGTVATTGILGFDISGTTVVSGGVVPLNSWNHVAVTRSAGTIYLWLNGVNTAGSPVATSINYAAVMRVGRGKGSSTAYFAGYMSNLRFTVGTALYPGSDVPSASAQYLIVAGGGSGGGGNSGNSSTGGGGGGAGGLLTGNFSLNYANTYVITVGGGGAGVGAGNRGNSGSASGIIGASTNIATVGGGGGGTGFSISNTDRLCPGRSGGSGGGAGATETSPSTLGGSGTAGQGYAGGNAASIGAAGGGGGGAGGVGARGSGAKGGGSGGLGGVGVYSNITGATVGYAGGGSGGRGLQTVIDPSVGFGGGGSTIAGTTNTGGGGGGGGIGNGIVVASGGAGGSGVVIISHSNTTPTGTVTGNPRITTTGSNIVYTFTASGSIVVGGSTAFNPPLAPVPAVQKTVLLLNSADAAIKDQTGRNPVLLTGDTRLASSTTKYSGRSMYFDGTGDYLATPYSTTIDVVPGSWTIEAWIYPTTVKTTATIFALGGGVNALNSTTGIHLEMHLVGIGGAYSYLYGAVSNNSAGFGFSSSTPIYANTWTHVAVCLSTTNTTIQSFVNGTVVYSNTYATYARPSTNPILGVGIVPGDTTTLFQGYIDNLRLTKGVARYTTNFVPPWTSYSTR